MDAIWSSLLITAELASTTTLLLLPVGVALGWWLARSAASWKDAIAAIVSMPLVLPPTVLGFYLLIAMGPNGPGGALASLWGGRTLAFSFAGLVVGSAIYSLPFMVQPLRIAFQEIGKDPFEAAATLGASQRQILWRIALPLAKTGLFTGVIMTFAHTVGEFGVVLMIGGNIPGSTKVVSVALYDVFELGLSWQANAIAAGIVVFTFIVLWATTLARIKRKQVHPI